jgi:hypothetical protein
MGLTMSSLSPIRAEEIANGEFYFLFGYQKFIKREFNSALDSFQKAIDESQENDLLDKSRLYQSLTLAKLKRVKEASVVAANIGDSEFEKRDQLLFMRLKKFLGREYEEAKEAKIQKENKKSRIKIALSPSLLSSSFSSELPRETSLQYGADLTFSRPQWNLSLFGALSSHAFKSKAENFNQSQINLIYSWEGTSANWIFHGGLIKSEAQDYNASTFGLGTIFKITESFHFGYDFMISSYPNSSLGAMTVNQANFLIDYWFVKSKESEVKFGFKTQTIKPISDTIQNDLSFIENKFYQSFLIELFARIESFEARTYYWTGEEVFGARQNGRQVFTYPEIHSGGLGTTLSFMTNETDKLHLSYLQEDIKMQTSKGQSSSLMATYDYLFE